MKPINKSERNKAIIKFFLLLSIFVALVIMVIFFDFKVPSVENKYLHSQMKKTEKLMDIEEDFAEKMDRVKALIDTMDQPGVNSEYIEQLISTQLADMQTSLPSDSTFRHDMYTNVIQTYLELKNAKSSLMELSDVQKELEEYSELVDRYREDLEQAHRDLDLYRQMRN